jgi:hypothetical protein
VPRPDVVAAVPVAAAQGPAQRHSTMANLACYPALNVPNGFTAAGAPTNVTFFARPFGEAELLALAKAYQDVAKHHLVKPTKMDLVTTCPCWCLRARCGCASAWAYAVSATRSP